MLKGIYANCFFENAENKDGTFIKAVIPENTDQPGYDVNFVVNGQVIQPVQL